MTPTGAGAPRSRWARAGFAAIALLAYVPPLTSHPGRVAADTKTYLYLDPARMLGRSAAMWDPNIGFGTVTHQNIGYLFPMGPWYLAWQRLGVPDWVAQRLWLGTLVAAAGFGVVFLCRVLGTRGPGVPVAVLAYMFSPYSLHYAARISVLLGPWAALPWMIALVALALRRPRGWFHPACFALVVQLVGGVNATALIFAGLGPVAYLGWSWLVARESSWRDVLAVVWRVGLLTALTSAWWVAGLSLQGAYGLDILRYTETIMAVARTSTPTEVLRGLGYWFFYGRDRLGAWIEAAPNYTQRPRIIATSFAVPVLALLAAGAVRWRRRSFFVLLTVLGVVIAVGANPYADPTPLGALFKAFANSSTAGLALRSTGRADPLVVLGLAMLLGAGVSASCRFLGDTVRFERIAVLPAVLVGGLVLSSFPALYDGTYYGRNLERPEDVPTYWTQAAAYLDRESHATRVLELPGADFASYRWGNTVDPITPGLMDRPYVARELIPYGSAPSADFLNAIDRRLQEGVADPVGFVDLLRRAGVGTVVLRNDVQWERYNLVRPRELVQILRQVHGVRFDRSFGPTVSDSDAVGIVDERTLNPRFSTVAAPHAVEILHVENPWPIVRAVPADAQTVVVDGDGEGVVDAAAVGALAGDGVVLQSPSFAGRADALRRAAGAQALLVVTDQNRRRARRWSTVLDNTGYTEQTGETPLRPDVSDARLPVFPGAGDDAFTVQEQRGVRRIQATAYGNPISYTPEDRPALAFDGNPETGWAVGAFDRVVGQRIEVETTGPVTTDHLRIVQKTRGPRDRWITTVRLRFDGGTPVDLGLDDRSRVRSGQVLRFGRRRFTTLSIEIRSTNQADGPLYAGQSAVGLEEIGIVDDATHRAVRVREVARLPLDLLSAFGHDALQHPLVVTLTRQRVREVPPRSDEDWSIQRSVHMPDARAFALSGSARIDAYALDPRVIDDVLGLRGPVRVWANQFLPDCLTCRGVAALDGDVSTAWSTPVDAARDQWLIVQRDTPFALDHLDMTLVADQLHSWPTAMRVELGGRSVDVAVPPVALGAPGHRARVRLALPAMRGNRLRVTLTAVANTPTHSFYAGDATLGLPVAIAELGVPEVVASRGQQTFDTGCRDDLVRVGAQRVPVRIHGDRAAAELGGVVPVEACGNDDVSMRAGATDVVVAPGGETGVSIDRLVLSSAAGGRARPVSALVAPSHPLLATTTSKGRLAFDVSVDAGSKPFWLVLGQSVNAGWEARVHGRPLGGSEVVDGYANGWLVRTPTPGERIEVEWTPQRRVWLALWISGFAVLGCLVLLVVTRRHRAGPVPDADVAHFDITSLSLSPPIATRRTVIAALGVAAVASVIAAPWIGVVAALATVIGARWHRVRWALCVAPGAIYALVGAYVTQGQWRHRFPAVFEWPTLFSRVVDASWLVVALLIVLVVLEWLDRTES